MTTITDTPGNGFDTRVDVRHHHWNTIRPHWARFNDDGSVDVIAIRKDGDFGGLYMSVDPKLVERVA